MSRTREHLEQVARDAERWLDEMDPAEIAKPEADASDLRRIGQAVIERERVDKEIETAVRAARNNGRTWGQIADPARCHDTGRPGALPHSRLDGADGNHEPRHPGHDR